MTDVPEPGNWENASFFESIMRVSMGIVSGMVLFGLGAAAFSLGSSASDITFQPEPAAVPHRIIFIPSSYNQIDTREPGATIIRVSDFRMVNKDGTVFFDMTQEQDEAWFNVGDGTAIEFHPRDDADRSASGTTDNSAI